MHLQKIKIRLYSEIKDISSVSAAINKLEVLNNFELLVSDPKDFTVDAFDIAVIQITSIKSNLLSGLIDIKSSLRENIIFVVQDDKALLISTLIKLGFTDIFVFPFEIVKFTSYLGELLEQCKNKNLSGEGITDDSGNYFAATGTGRHSPLYSLVKKVADNPSVNVMITGETGTGKGLLARTIHDMTNSNAPFVDILCTSIPEALLESELFGHEKGAFTNAQTRKIGLFELAGNGTLFLDEIGDLSLNLQSKLLRVIEKKVIRRIGGLHDIPVNTRIISASNKNIQKLMEDNIFRSDLFYRLNSVTIELEPLKHRGKEITSLLNYFLRYYNRQFNKKIKRLDKNVEKFVMSYPWPGNVRELKNSVERAVLLGDGPSLKLKHFHKPKINFSIDNAQLVDENESLTISFDINKTSLKDLNKIYIEKMIDKLEGNKARACEILGIPRSTLYRILR